MCGFGHCCFGKNVVFWAVACKKLSKKKKKTTFEMTFTQTVVVSVTANWIISMTRTNALGRRCLIQRSACWNALWRCAHSVTVNPSTITSALEQHRCCWWIAARLSDSYERSDTILTTAGISCPSALSIDSCICGVFTICGRIVTC